MKVLLLGGTGTISTAVTSLAVEEGWEVTILNRGRRDVDVPDDVELIQADIADEDDVIAKIGERHFDVVADFICFTPEHAARALRLFHSRTDQYLFISSASVYQKPLSDYLVRESTPLSNPFWQYSQNKIACEEIFTAAYRERGFPVTIVRPSHTYGERGVPLGYHGAKGSWSVLQRMLRNQPVVVPGDGSSLWTMTWNEDFAVGFNGLMGNPRALGETVHITSDESLTWNQIHNIVGEALGVKPDLYHISTDFIAACDSTASGSLIGDKANTVVFDNRKIKRLVPAFNATTRFDRGIRRSIAYVLAHPELQVEDPDFDRLCDRMIQAQETARRTVLEQD